MEEGEVPTRLLIFKLQAKWDLEIKNQNEAEKIVKDARLKSSSTERYVVLGYKIKEEVKN